MNNYSINPRRRRSEVIAFALAAFGFIVFVSSAIVTSVPAVIFGLLMVFLGLFYFLIGNL